MKKYLALIMFFAAATGCGVNDKTSANEVAVTDTPTNDILSPAGCHSMIIEKDTAYMSLQESGDSLYGPLEYKRFEKDSNKGTVRLLKKNGRAEGWYYFQSEGMQSVRQVIFKMSGDSLSEAYGDIILKGDTAMYKYPHALQFEEKHSFVKVNCK